MVPSNTGTLFLSNPPGVSLQRDAGIHLQQQTTRKTLTIRIRTPKDPLGLSAHKAHYQHYWQLSQLQENCCYDQPTYEPIAHNIKTAGTSDDHRTGGQCA